MIAVMSGFPEGTLGFKIRGHVTGEDYDNVLTPAIDKAIEEHDRVKLLVQVGPGFEGFRGLQSRRGLGRHQARAAALERF